MHDDSGVELQDSQDRLVPSASPHTPRKPDYVKTLAELIRQPAFKETGALCPFDEVDARVPDNGEEDAGQGLPKQVQLVLISCGKASLADKYRNMFELPFRMFTDPEMRLYEALGMGKMGRGGGGSGDKLHHAQAHAEVEKETAENEKNVEGEPVERAVSPMATVTRRSFDNGNGSYVKHGLMGGIGMVVMRALKAGMPIWENGGDIAQLGGEFVLGPGMTCVFAHRMQHPKGHAPVLEVLKAANVNIPDEVLQSLGVSGPTSLALVSESDVSSISFAPPPSVICVPGPSKPTQQPEGKENKLTKKKSVSSSVSTVRRSGSFKTLTSLVSPSPPLQSVNGHGSTNARAMKRLGISPSSVDRHAGSSGKKSSRKHHHTHSSILSQILDGGSGKDYRNDDRHTRSAPAVTIPLPPAKTTFATSSSRSLVDEEEQTWMESRQRDLEALRQRKDTRRRTGTPGSVSLSGRASAMSSPVPVPVPLGSSGSAGAAAAAAAENGHPSDSHSPEHRGSHSSHQVDTDSGYGSGLSNTNGRVESGRGHTVDESGVLVRPRGEVLVHELPFPSEGEDTIRRGLNPGIALLEFSSFFALPSGCM
ncbi:hypothetical protein H1R20_g12463, partial [Candolleomyces eurysporus]